MYIVFGGALQRIKYGTVQHYKAGATGEEAIWGDVRRYVDLKQMSNANA